MEGDRKLLIRIIIIVFFGVFIILPLSLTLVANIVGDDEPISEEIALVSDVSEGVTEAIEGEFGAEVDNYVMHEILEDGDYVIALVIYTLPSDFSNAILVVLQEKSDGYEIVYKGDSYTKMQLETAGVPGGIINKIMEKSSLISKYAVAVASSSINPVNKYTLVNALPYSADGLRISYYYEDGLVDEDGIGVPTVEVNAVDATERINALDAIRRMEFDPADYHIIYTNFVNPFTGEDR